MTTDMSKQVPEDIPTPGRRGTTTTLEVIRTSFEENTAEKIQNNVSIIDLVSECHRYAYTRECVLHPDLGEDDHDSEDSSKVKGILNNWHTVNANIATGSSAVSPSTASHPTDTLPVMADGLLREHLPKPHMDRHDLVLKLQKWSGLFEDALLRMEVFLSSDHEDVPPPPLVGSSWDIVQ
ncbi:hypothetical protein DXG03_001890 [Asterophora parasitica]|uniref:Uncharacterized protein n=1 Tax=Asterophora parasitica TaxID=117018 RepID=A0A9P7G4W5_9AGAR|nr:hypothetical protein DXG03_001890 [Asterophora parasitica]